jgi:hypothetical protein
MASWKGHADVVKVLLENGADPNKANIAFGYTPLRNALGLGLGFSSNIDLAKLLIAAGADPNKGDNNGNTLLHLAIRRGRTMMVRVLLEQKADANQLNSDGRPPLHLAVMLGEGRMVQLLLEHGARVNETVPRADGQDPNENYTALFEFLLTPAVMGDRMALEITQLLVAAGANTVHTRQDGLQLEAYVEAGRNQNWGVTAAWLTSTYGMDRAEIIKSLVVSLTPAIPVDTFSLVQSLSASEARAALLPRTPAQSEESDRVLDLCRELRMEWSERRHGLFHPAFRSTVLCLMLIVRRDRRKLSLQAKSILGEIPLEVWFLIIAQLPRDKWPFRRALPITFVRPSGARALPVQKGTGITTDFTTAQSVVGVGTPRRAKGGVTDDFEVEYGRAMASTVSYVDRLLKRTPKNPSILTAARATALEISRRIEARVAAGRSPIVVECARTLLDLEKRLSATETMKLAKVYRNLFDTAADVMTKIHIETGILPGDYGAGE